MATGFGCIGASAWIRFRASFAPAILGRTATLHADAAWKKARTEIHWHSAVLWHRIKEFGPVVISSTRQDSDRMVHEPRVQAGNLENVWMNG